MNYESYSDIEFTEDLRQFVFVSAGKCGSLLKGVRFTPTQRFEVYNMHFGDIDQDDEIDDLAISNNGDRDKILATLVVIMDMYTEKYPARRIYFRGSTPGRTRLYRMVISLNLKELSEKFEIYAKVKENIPPVAFQKNMPVIAFEIKRKTII